MKIGILGSGGCGEIAGEGFLVHGHEAMLGTRDPGKLELARRESERLGRELCRDRAIRRVGRARGQGHRRGGGVASGGCSQPAGKTIIDATNPIADAPPANGVLKFFTSLDDSLMERLQREFPDAHFVKAFNSVGNARMVNPNFDGGKPTMFICGNDAAAKRR